MCGIKRHWIHAAKIELYLIEIKTKIPTKRHFFGVAPLLLGGRGVLTERVSVFGASGKKMLKKEKYPSDSPKLDFSSFGFCGSPGPDCLPLAATAAALKSIDAERVKNIFFMGFDLVEGK
jgi:hypothetical protein